MNSSEQNCTSPIQYCTVLETRPPGETRVKQKKYTYQTTPLGSVEEFEPAKTKNWSSAYCLLHDLVTISIISLDALEKILCIRVFKVLNLFLLLTKFFFSFFEISWKKSIKLFKQKFL